MTEADKAVIKELRRQRRNFLAQADRAQISARMLLCKAQDARDRARACRSEIIELGGKVKD